MKNIEEFYNEIMASEELKDKLAEASANQKLDEFLKENGIDCTKEQLREYALAKAAESGELSDEELRIIAGGRDGEENDSKPGSASTPTAIAWDEKGRAIQWKDGKDIYHYECCKCHKWLYLDWVRWYCPECGEGFYWNVEKYRVCD